MEQRYKERLCVGFDPKVMRAIEALSLEWDCNLSETVRRLVEKGLIRTKRIPRKEPFTEVSN